MYKSKKLNEMREILEEEFREQYDICCDANNLDYMLAFKKAFESIVESLADFDKLL
ncbi:hypothetical protein Cpap_1506 [Ruminiclostridium papyrosolvens DSM 2782]|uniref:Uncharacterized protein n=1 Tax=Ruminiclostridium papyrosolvens DSM 2782 TaxID=588581 RepID=F1TEE8_9FIRM|nr:hypothetical protein [Ruminiclostridium papyrosolvens]EGD47114.1 hypothetical protein Cpap_1506 [Ruminiclostridium papyrosolvens DSM 2782]WES36057.1 hypothetical protein P0092_08865 [Ruminiclostridium papyrosolvens DSM 2782]WES36155.1 hypothetical protein P0092_09365 [Ruminiclostridium papyrosolvens DSM 2782]